jgi:hypothetical protein
MTGGERILVDLRKDELTGTIKNRSPAVFAARMGLTVREFTDVAWELQSQGDLIGVQLLSLDQTSPLVNLGGATLTVPGRRRADALMGR